MAVIKQLGPHVADLIAAGEVVERAPVDCSPRRKGIPPAEILRLRLRIYAGFPAGGALRPKGGSVCLTSVYCRPMWPT